MLNKLQRGLNEKGIKDFLYYNLLNKEKIMFKDKILLITGGTGSFGNAVLDSF